MEENDHISSDSASDEGFPDPMMEDDDDDLDNVSSGDENWFIFVKLYLVVVHLVFIMHYRLHFVFANQSRDCPILPPPLGGTGMLSAVTQSPVYTVVYFSLLHSPIQQSIFYSFITFFD